MPESDRNRRSHRQLDRLYKVESKDEQAVDSTSSDSSRLPGFTLSANTTVSAFAISAVVIIILSQTGSLHDLSEVLRAVACLTTRVNR